MSKSRFGCLCHRQQQKKCYARDCESVDWGITNQKHSHSYPYLSILVGLLFRQAQFATFSPFLPITSKEQMRMELVSNKGIAP